MSSDHTDAQLALDVIAAKSKQLARGLEGGHLWGGELVEGLAEIRRQLETAERYATGFAARDR